MTTVTPAQRYDEAVTAIYTDAYSAQYAALYTAPWQAKHRLNAANLEDLFAILPPEPLWLDIACGQAWHFARFPGRARKVGLDLSHAQLARAKTAPRTRISCLPICSTPRCQLQPSI